MAMNDELFADLMSSIEEAGHIARGEAAPSRTFPSARALNVMAPGVGNQYGVYRDGVRQQLPCRRRAHMRSTISATIILTIPGT
jgi:hypothetical protein